MKVKRFLLWLCVSLLLFTCTAGAWLWYGELGIFKTQIERLASKQLGRSLQINGELSLRLGSSINLEADGVQLANAAWAANPDLIEIQKLSVVLRTNSLWTDTIIVEELQVNGVQIHAERNSEGLASWELSTPAEQQDTGPASEKRFALRQINSDDVAVAYLATPESEPVRIELDTLEQIQTNEGMLNLSLIGRVNDDPLEYFGSLGPFENLVSGQNIRFDGNGRFSTMSVEGSGVIDNLFKPQQPIINIAVNGPNMADFADLLPLDNLPPIPYRVAVETQRIADRIELTAQARLEELVVSLHGRSDQVMGLDHFEYDLSANGPDLGRFTDFLGAGEWPNEPFQIKGQVSRDGPSLKFKQVEFKISRARFFVDGALSQFPNLSRGELEMEISGADVAAFRDLLKIRGAAEGPFSVSLNLVPETDGQDRISGEIETSMIKAQLSGQAGTGPGLAGTELQISLNGPDASTLLTTYGINLRGAEPFGADAKLALEDARAVVEQGSWVTLGDHRLDLSGVVNFKPLEKDSEVKFKLQGNDLAQLLLMGGPELPVPSGEYQISGELRTTERGLEFSGLTGNIAADSFSLEGLLTLQPDLTGTQVTFSGSGPNLSTLMQNYSQLGFPARAYSAAGILYLEADDLRLKNLDITYGQLHARGSLTFVKPVADLNLVFDLLANGPSAQQAVPRIGDWQLADRSFQLKAAGRLSADELSLQESFVQLGDDVNFNAEGTLHRVSGDSETDMTFSFGAPRFDSVFSQPQLPISAVPLSIAGKFSSTGSLVRLSSFQAQAGGSDMTGIASLSLDGETPYLKVDAQSETLDFGELGTEFEPAQPSADKNQRLIPDFEFPMDTLAMLNADVNFSAGTLRTKLQDYSDLSISGNLNDGVLKLERFHAYGLDGEVQGQFSLTPRADQAPELDLSLDLSGLVLDLSRNPDVNTENLPIVNLEMSLIGFGYDLRSVAGSVSGHIYADSSSGIIPDSLISGLDANLLEQIFNTILPPQARDSDTNLKCFAARLEAENGKVRANPGVAIVTDKVQIISRGTINLGNEALNLDIESYPTKAYQTNLNEVLLNPFVKIAGTLANPRPTLNTERALIFSGAAAASGGLSILAKGLLQRMTSARDPCARFMEEKSK